MTKLILNLNCVDEIQREGMKKLLVETLQLNGFMTDHDLYEIETTNTLRVGFNDLKVPKPYEELAELGKQIGVTHSGATYVHDQALCGLCARGKSEHLDECIKKAILKVFEKATSLEIFGDEVMASTRTVPTGILNESSISYDPEYLRRELPEKINLSDNLKVELEKFPWVPKPLTIVDRIIASGPLACLVAKRDEVANDIKRIENERASKINKLMDIDDDCARLSKQINHDKGVAAYRKYKQRKFEEKMRGGNSES